jgi:hypothetical protein
LGWGGAARAGERGMDAAEKLPAERAIAAWLAEASDGLAV